MEWNVLLIRAVVGLLATVIMDLGGGLGLLLGVAVRKPQRMGHHLIGRWIGYMFWGIFKHADILSTPPLRGELLFGILMHYLIGIILTIIYFTLLAITHIQTSALIAIAFGLGTTVFPWFVNVPIRRDGVDGKSCSRKRAPGHGQPIQSCFLWVRIGFVERVVQTILNL